MSRFGLRWAGGGSGNALSGDRRRNGYSPVDLQRAKGGRFQRELVSNGVDGLHLAADENWDVVILDRLLPGNAYCARCRLYDCGP